MLKLVIIGLAIVGAWLLCNSYHLDGWICVGLTIVVAVIAGGLMSHGKR